MTRLNFLFSILIIAICITVVGPIKADDWYLNIDTGSCVPTESFDEIMDDDVTYGLNIDYIPSNHLGVRIAYSHHEFEYDYDDAGLRPLEIDTLGIWAVMDYVFPNYFRFYAIIGPTYFYAKQDYGLGWGEDDSQDIGWSGGAGFEFYPVPGWGFRFQSLYNSAEIGDGSPRASWVNTSLGMSFKF
ncbi:porin family protein [bacterium]|nr:porin family protein [bacterium]